MSLRLLIIINNIIIIVMMMMLLMMMRSLRDMYEVAGSEPDAKECEVAPHFPLGPIPQEYVDPPPPPSPEGAP
eukprot:4569191-Karenia_brevis.AAC.1